MKQDPSDPVTTFVAIDFDNDDRVNIIHSYVFKEKGGSDKIKFILDSEGALYRALDEENGCEQGEKLGVLLATLKGALSEEDVMAKFRGSPMINDSTEIEVFPCSRNDGFDVIMGARKA
jgi:hypothetical protein